MRVGHGRRGVMGVREEGREVREVVVGEVEVDVEVEVEVNVEGDVDIEASSSGAATRVIVGVGVGGGGRKTGGGCGPMRAGRGRRVVDVVDVVSVVSVVSVVDVSSPVVSVVSATPVAVVRSTAVKSIGVAVSSTSTPSFDSASEIGSIGPSVKTDAPGPAASADIGSHASCGAGDRHPSTVV